MRTARLREILDGPFLLARERHLNPVGATPGPPPDAGPEAARKVAGHDRTRHASHHDVENNR